MSTPTDFRLETYLSRWEFTARYHLTASDAESMTVSDLLAMASDEEKGEFENLWLGYTQTFGEPELREEIARTYESQSADNILCFAGAGEGIYIANHVLLDPGDHAVAITPNYQSAESVPLTICEVTGVALNPEGGWHLDLDRLIDAIRPNTKLISINCPHNPTGWIIPREQLDVLVEVCRKHGIWLLSDEVYRLLGSFPERQVPQAADLYERGLSLNVMSKAYGLPGLRIGWIATQDRDVLVRMERMKHYLSIANSGPSEVLARIALRNRSRILARINGLVVDNLALLDVFFAEFRHLFEWQRPDGSCVAFPRYLGTDGADNFAERLVEETGVLLLPPHIYSSDLNATPNDRFRIGFGRAAFPEGLEVLRSYLLRNAD